MALNLHIDEKGVRLRAVPDSVAETVQGAKLIAAISLPLNLLNEAVQEFYAGQKNLKDAEDKS